MKHGGCSMMPLVEAHRDGRLDERERGSIERHLTTCPECRERAAGFARLAELSRGAPRPTSALEHRRGRMRLLQAAAVIEGPADRGTLGGLSGGEVPAGASVRVPIAAVALAAGMLLAVGQIRARVAAGAAPPAVVTAATPAPSVASVGSAAASGEANAPVPERAAPPRSMANAPVPPAQGDEPPSPPNPRTTAEPRPRGASRVPAPRVAATAEAPVVQDPAAHHPAGTASSPAPASASGDAPREANLQSAVGSLAQGNYGEAADRLRDFQKSHAGDPRAEDAAFLVIVALDRAGKRDEAAAAARAYLATYPRGYRRDEAAAIAGR